MTTIANRLAAETSPYLLQHAHNPVAWQPWDAAALEQARREDKPILLSIGYSACHWCHVMAHESFEDAATAALMNQLYVNIKVDREERPDLDKIYQLAHQLLARRGGGWPLTVFLDPHDHTPIFAGTYFPPQPRHNLPSFSHMLQQVADFYHQRKDDLAENSRMLLQALRAVEGGNASAMPGAALAAQACAALAGDYDARHGGFGDAPKFPMTSSLELLLRRGHGGDAAAMDMALHALRCMAVSGLFDQLGGGFFRYSVDERWEIPHFEKMLYDNALLLALYSQAHAAGGQAVYGATAHATAAWLMTAMQAAEGGYYATLDADAAGEEGSYYVWDANAARALLSAEEWAVARRCFGLDLPANFEGRRHLRRMADPNSEDEPLLDTARAKLLAARGLRAAPRRDEKILTAWNGMAIRAMALAGHWLDKPEYLAAATRAAGFLQHNSWRDGRLFACYKDGQARFPAYLDDYACLLDGLLELLQARWHDDWLAWAIALADDLLARFADGERGGFYFTAVDHESLLHRPKPLSDESTPSGNGVAALALLRLGHLLGDARYLRAAERTLQAASEAMQRYPAAHAALLCALDDWLEPQQIVILRGAAPAMAAWLREAALPWHPRRLVFAIPAEAAGLPPGLAARPAGDAVLAYVCANGACRPPLDAPARLRELLLV
ncbi:MAG: thioredoxin domain-containing protein [Methylococcaceae bacterium]|nr:MAG: thioredoxin domain-containing protein [Methylococcaceae bacterium]